MLPVMFKSPAAFRGELDTSAITIGNTQHPYFSSNINHQISYLNLDAYQVSSPDQPALFPWKEGMQTKSGSPLLALIRALPLDVAQAGRRSAQAGSTRLRGDGLATIRISLATAGWGLTGAEMTALKPTYCTGGRRLGAERNNGSG
jgi:hypothetical protein